MDLTIPCFDPALIARSGQCFRMCEGKGGIVTALAGADRVRVTPLGGDRFRFDCPPEDFERRWRAYFDLDTDYEAIQREAAGQDELLAHAACTCRGLRILRQDPWETLVCFLISQRKSIPAIQTCVEALCTRCGAKVGRGRGRYFAFPGPEDLLRAGERGLRACGTGYRAPYLLDAARRVADGRADLDAMAAQGSGLLGRTPEFKMMVGQMEVATTMHGGFRDAVKWVQPEAMQQVYDYLLEALCAPPPPAKKRFGLF